jgi:hypothetical protein
MAWAAKSWLMNSWQLLLLHGEWHPATICHQLVCIK